MLCSEASHILWNFSRCYQLLIGLRETSKWTATSNYATGHFDPVLCDFWNRLSNPFYMDYIWSTKVEKNSDQLGSLLFEPCREVHARLVRIGSNTHLSWCPCGFEFCNCCIILSPILWVSTDNDGILRKSLDHRFYCHNCSGLDRQHSLSHTTGWS